MAETDTERIAKLETQIAQLKEAISSVNKKAESSITEIKDESGRISRSLTDRLTQISNLASENGEKVKGLQALIVGDGDQEPGVKAELKVIEKDVSELKLTERDRSTRNNFVRGVWAGVGALLFGIGVTLFRGVIDEKASNAAKTQDSNVQRFSKIEEKVENNNNQFYKSIGELKEHKSGVDKDIDWIKTLIKK